MKKNISISLITVTLILVFTMNSYGRTRRSSYGYDNPTHFTSFNAGFFLPTSSTDNGGGLDDGFTIGVNSFVPMKIRNVRIKLPEMALGISCFYSHASFLQDNENDGDESFSLFQIVPSVRAINPFGPISPLATSFIQLGIGIYRSDVEGSELLDLGTNDIGVSIGGGVSVNRFEYNASFTYILNDNAEHKFVSLTIGYKFF